MKTMKTIMIVVLYTLATSAALADDLQFTRGDASYVSYAEVRVLDPANQQVFTGTTDKYGRIAVPLPPGPYRIEVRTLDRTLGVTVQFTGVQGLRPVSI